jgi:molecular chaperone DnaK (HSP70)
MAVIVPAQTAIPCRLSHTFTTVSDFQTEIHTEVRRGEERRRKNSLGKEREGGNWRRKSRGCREERTREQVGKGGEGRNQ